MANDEDDHDDVYDGVDDDEMAGHLKLRLSIL